MRVLGPLGLNRLRDVLSVIIKSKIFFFVMLCDVNKLIRFSDLVETSTLLCAMLFDTFFVYCKFIGVFIIVVIYILYFMGLESIFGYKMVVKIGTFYFKRHKKDIHLK